MSPQSPASSLKISGLLKERGGLGRDLVGGAEVRCRYGVGAQRRRQRVIVRLASHPDGLGGRVLRGIVVANEELSGGEVAQAARQAVRRVERPKQFKRPQSAVQRVLEVGLIDTQGGHDAKAFGTQPDRELVVRRRERSLDPAAALCPERPLVPPGLKGSRRAQDELEVAGSPLALPATLRPCEQRRPARGPTAPSRSTRRSAVDVRPLTFR